MLPARRPTLSVYSVGDKNKGKKKEEKKDDLMKEAGKAFDWQGRGWEHFVSTSD